MRFVQTGEGFVDRRSPADPRPLASGPRFARVDGELLCSYMVQSKLGINDFLPLLARSRDDGRTWSVGEPMWPHHADAFSIFGAISPAPVDGQLLYVGARYVIDEPGEPNWSDATSGLKQNQMFWAHSTDGLGGRAWSEPNLIPMPIPGSAEATSPICVTSGGGWVVPYSPYNTFDPAVQVDRGQVVLLGSDDRGATWWHRSMLRFSEPLSGGAEAWAVNLADGRLLGTAWHTDLSGAGRSYPNAYALSRDGGNSWTATRDTGIPGHSTALTPLPDGRALFLHTRRDPSSASAVGVWAAVIEPTPADFGVCCHAPLWRATGGPGTSTHEAWTQFTFGEPAAVLLDDGEILLGFWYAEAQGSGIRLVRFRIEP
jgi:hypothetical protein